MARTDRFRQQHNEILVLAKELQTHLSVAALSTDATEARRCLGSLMGKLSLHLAAEDKVLYPELAANKDVTVSEMARRFSVEMMSTATQVTAYSNKWPTPTAIKANATDFVKETKQVLGILADRIKRENLELYAVADLVEGKSFE